MANPYESSFPSTEFKVPPRKTGGFTWIELLVVIGIIAVLVALFLPAVRRSGGREATRRMHCRNNLKQLVLALHDYHDAHGHFPPAFTVDPDGNRLHSWRTLILPFVEQKALYETIDLTKAWDHPANSLARGTTIPTYCCPSTRLEPGFTTYKGIVGATTFFPDDGTSRAIDDIADGTAQTLAITEVVAEQASHWMDPYNDDGADLLLNLSADTATSHAGGFQCATADGSVTFLSNKMPLEQVQALVSVSGGEKVGSY